MDGHSYTFDFKETLLRFIKYLIEGFVVSAAAFLILFKNGQNMDYKEIAILGMIAGCTFAILDLFSPSIGVNLRQGAGFGLGAKMVNFPA